MFVHASLFERLLFACLRAKNVRVQYLNALERPFEYPVAVWKRRPEAQVFELELEIVETEAPRDRCVDVERLARHGAAPRRRHGIERAHVVGAVRELDQDDAQVAHHRQHHLAEGLGLRLGA